MADDSGTCNFIAKLINHPFDVRMLVNKDFGVGRWCRARNGNACVPNKSLFVASTAQLNEDIDSMVCIIVTIIVETRLALVLSASGARFMVLGVVVFTIDKTIEA
jgi:hypothetical protein